MSDPSVAARLAVYYEHPRWFERMFAELDRQSIAYRKLHVEHARFDPADRAPAALGGARVVFNRMSPSAYHRGHGSAIVHTLALLGALEQSDHRVLNGERAFRHEISKALQLSVLARLGLPAPATRVIHRIDDAPAASEGLRFPIVIKPNVGGSGVGVVRFDSLDQLRAAAAAGRLTLGFDHVGLVQEFIPARGGHIVRIECVGGRYLYGIKVHLTGQTFDLCPADICRTSDGQPLDTACVVDAPKQGLKVESFTAPPHVIRAVERMLSAMGIDVGGVEYVVDDRDGQMYFYDVNALSNFVADAPNVIGFDPFVHLVNYLRAEVNRG